MENKYELLSGKLDERAYRLVLAAEAYALGRGGITTVHNYSGVSRVTITNGINELLGKTATAGKGRVRKVGGGRKKAVSTDASLLSDLQKLLEGCTRGDPMCPLLWTTKSLRKLELELLRLGHNVKRTVINKLMWSLGYSLKGNCKTNEGADIPYRNEQFQHINATVKAFQAQGQPVISVDCKKHENIGNYKNNGKEWHRKGEAPQVNVYDFVGEEGKALPYGIYDLANNNGYVNVGVTHDTAEFAVESIRRWWSSMGKVQYLEASELYITADGGGSNGSRVRLWKTELQRFSTETGLKITVSHYPPGTSKWNKIEHRLFSIISMNWRGKPLETLGTIVNLISNTTTTTEMTIQCDTDRTQYETGKKITDEEFKKVNIVKNEFMGKWNYQILPKL
jgi:hypothetical protein